MVLLEGHDDDTSELVSKFSEQVSNCSTYSTRTLSLSLSNNTDTSLFNFPPVSTLYLSKVVILSMDALKDLTVLNV